ncbi:MAG: 2-oxoacid:acceptor oxidoreductase family protein, partial [Candidatus Omnitrophica bacterium]|nr:2-oxoacid:acceptor oxidoreductase family protein [Candidatus Omnitrophota bacterium]
MAEYSILIGGKAGEGINQAGSIIAQLFNTIGYRTYVYFDYPSLIRGGHNFSIIRASKDKVETHRNKVDFILALNQDCVTSHKDRLKDDSIIIYDADTVKADGRGFSITKIAKEEKAEPIMRNSCIIGCFAKTAGIAWDVLEAVLRKSITRETELNLKLARRGYDAAEEARRIEPIQQKSIPILTGNEAVGMGLVKGGLKNYISYPMTPTSSLLHFLAQEAEKFSIKVIHPENEISVILMALGFSYMGERTAVGTSGGGFCLMT